MSMSSKFLTESTGEKIVKIGQYLAKIWTKYDSLVFLGHPVCKITLAISPLFFSRHTPYLANHALLYY